MFAYCLCSTRNIYSPREIAQGDLVCWRCRRSLNPAAFRHESLDPLEDPKRKSFTTSDRIRYALESDSVLPSCRS